MVAGFRERRPISCPSAAFHTYTWPVQSVPITRLASWVGTPVAGISPGKVKLRLAVPPASQRVARRLRPTVTRSPVCARRRPEAPPLWAVQLLSWVTSSMFHSLPVPSSLTLATTLVLTHSRPVIRPRWPMREATRPPGSASHTWMPPARSPEATYLPFGPNRMAVTQSVCFLILCSISPVSVEKMRTRRSGPP